MSRVVMGRDGGKGKPLCKYFLSPKGCKYGAACRNTHSMAELTKAERFRKCLNCGSEGHRAADCQATRRQDPNKAQEPKPTPQVASSCQPIVPATPIMSMDSFLQQASQALRQLEAAQAIQGVSSGATASATLPVNPTLEGGGQQQPHRFYHACKLLPGLSFGIPNSGTPKPLFSSRNRGRLGGPDLEASNRDLGNGQKAGLEAKMATSAPSLPFQARELGLGPEERFCPTAYALLDSGATHPMRPASSQEEWEEAELVRGFHPPCA